MVIILNIVYIFALFFIFNIKFYIMALVQNPIIGRAKNKFGNAIFSTWKGKNVLRTKPLEVANPREPGQVLQRNRLTKAVQLYRMAKGVVDIGYKSQAVGRTEYNSFVSQIMPAITQDGNTTNVVVAYDELMYSKGSLPFTAIDCLGSDNTQIDVAWEDESGVGVPTISGHDKLLVFALIVKSGTGEIIEWLSSFDASSRAQSGVTIPWDNSLSIGYTMYVYASFVSEDGRTAQDSVVSTVIGS